MKPAFSKSKPWAYIISLALALLTPGWAAAQPAIDRIVVFGTSLSDPGNAYALTGLAINPPYDALDKLLIPDAPYNTGGHHFSNGATWIEQLALMPGFAGDVRPALQGANSKAGNYAVGGARAWNDGINLNLTAQVSAFLRDADGIAARDVLYVVEFGGNDIRDALFAYSNRADGGAIIRAALLALEDNITALYRAGARKFLVLNAPNLRLVPAIRILDRMSPGAGHVAEFFTLSFNEGLRELLGSAAGLPGIQITMLDLFRKLHDLSENPASYGLREVTTACITPNQPPFRCGAPDEYLFWDGIHPTKVVHNVLAMEAALALSP